MDDKTFRSNTPQKLTYLLDHLDTTVEQLQEAARDMAEWKEDIAAQINYIEKKIAHFDELISQTGLTRLHMETQAVLSLGQEHVKAVQAAGDAQLQAIKKQHETLQRSTQKSVERLDRAAAYTVKHISDALQSFRISDFQDLTQHNCAVVTQTSASALNRFQGVLRSFQWKSMGAVLATGIFVAMTFGWYLNDELPWESHRQAIAERHAGQALMQAWPSLSQEEQAHIMKHPVTKAWA